MGKFMMYTNGLVAVRRGAFGLVRVAFSREADGSVTLRAVNANTLSPWPVLRTISGAEFAGRPCDPYNDTVEAVWALRLLGYSVPGCSDDFEE